MQNYDNKEKRPLFYLNLILLFLIFSIGIIIAAYLYYNNYEKQYRTEVENQLNAIADLKTGEIVQWRKERLEDGSMFYKNELFSNHVKRYFKDQKDTDAEKRIKAWMEQVQISNNYDGVFLFDTLFTKRLLIPDNIGNRSKINISQSIKDSLKSGKIVFDDFYSHETTQKIFLRILIPIVEENNSNQIIGIAELRIDPEIYLYPLISQWPTPSKTSETIIARRQGNDAVYLNKLKFKENTALNFRIPLERKEILTVKAVLGETGIKEGVDYRDVEGIADVRPVPNSTWYMITKMDKAEIYAPMKEKQWTMVIFVTIFIFGISAGIGLLWRRQNINFYKEKVVAADTLIIANKELAFQNLEKEKRADELAIANKELAFQNLEKEKRVAELAIASRELVYQNEEKEKRAAELVIADKELAFQNLEKEKRATELVIADKELAFQNLEKEKRAAELVIADKELSFQNLEKEKRAAELVIADKELAFQNLEKEKRAAELVIADKEIIIQNIEKEKQVAANKELEAFSYSVSHDLRGPLRHIGGFVDLLIKNNSSQLDESGLRYLNIISESSHEMGNLIDALLTFSRLSRTEMQQTNIDSKNLVTLVLKTFSDEIAQRNVEINISELPDIKGDENLIKQVWVNLISNALKYSRNKEKAVIDIGGKVENDITIFNVKDNGVGFDMKYADKLFGVFQRLHKARDFEGVGIGLANVNRIVVRHGGKCWAESEVGNGATFFFSKPNK